MTSSTRKTRVRRAGLSLPGRTHLMSRSLPTATGSSCRRPRNPKLSQSSGQRHRSMTPPARPPSAISSTPAPTIPPWNWPRPDPSRPSASSRSRARSTWEAPGPPASVSLPSEVSPAVATKPGTVYLISLDPASRPKTGHGRTASPHPQNRPDAEPAVAIVRETRREIVDSSLNLHHCRARQDPAWLAAKPERGEPHLWGRPQTQGFGRWGYPHGQPRARHPRVFLHHEIQRITVEFSERVRAEWGFAGA